MDWRGRYTLLRRSASAVVVRVVAGVKLAPGRTDERRTDDCPWSTRLVPDDERWKCGWLGRDMARDCLDPDMERAWPPAKVDALLELDRFMVEPGWGIAEFRLSPPRVLRRARAMTGSACPDVSMRQALVFDYLGGVLSFVGGGEALTSRGLRTLHRPVSCDMLVPSGDSYRKVLFAASFVGGALDVKLKVWAIGILA